MQQASFVHPAIRYSQSRLNSAFLSNFCAEHNPGCMKPADDLATLRFHYCFSSKVARNAEQIPLHG